MGSVTAARMGIVVVTAFTSRAMETLMTTIAPGLSSATARSDLGIALTPPLAGIGFDHNVLTLDVTKVPQLFEKRLQFRRCLDSCGRDHGMKRSPRGEALTRSSALARVAGNRQRARDEFPSLHSPSPIVMTQAV